MSVRYRIVAVLLLAVALVIWACADLTVPNLNEPDRDRVRDNDEDVEALISGAYNSWFQSSFNFEGPATVFSQQSFQHSAPWSCATAVYSHIPRIGIQNDPAYTYFSKTAHVWYRSYQAITAAREGLEALEDADSEWKSGETGLHRGRAFGHFVLGLSYGNLALLYDKGFIAGPSDEPDPRRYDHLMEVALEHLDQTVDIASAHEFQIPYGWVQADLDSGGLARLARSHRARLRAQVARTPQERASVNWASVLADVDAGVQDDFLMEMDWNNGWYNGAQDYLTWSNWSQLPYFIYGMADQSGNYQTWVNLPLEEMRHHLPDGRPMLIVTPDQRFPRGETVEEQRARGGLYFRMTEEEEEGNTWKSPQRGTWRWSWYKPGPRGLEYGRDAQFLQPLITLEEMRLLKAEGLYWMGNHGGAAEIINETRIRAGLSPTDAGGLNASCVPRLPDGSCGDLWEILKWEKRMETVWTGIAASNWFFDSRGWGDLWVDTPLQHPVPCDDLTVVGLTPCYSFGGPGGDMGSPGTSYQFRGEREIQAAFRSGGPGRTSSLPIPACDAPPPPRIQAQGG